MTMNFKKKTNGTQHPLLEALDKSPARSPTNNGAKPDKRFSEELGSSELNDSDVVVGAPPTGGKFGQGGSLLERLHVDTSSQTSDQFWAQELLNANNLLLKTDVQERAIPILARLLALGAKYQSAVLLNFLATYLKLRISKNRMGRQEYVAMALRAKGHDESSFDDWGN